MVAPERYNSLEPRDLGRSIVGELLERPPAPFQTLASFPGAGSTLSTIPRRSIARGQDLDVHDFHYRYPVLEDAFITLGEPRLITTFQPRSAITDGRACLPAPMEPPRLGLRQQRG